MTITVRVKGCSPMRFDIGGGMPYQAKVLRRNGRYAPRARVARVG